MSEEQYENASFNKVSFSNESEKETLAKHSVYETANTTHDLAVDQSFAKKRKLVENYENSDENEGDENDEASMRISEIKTDQNSKSNKKTRFDANNSDEDVKNENSINVVASEESDKTQNLTAAVAGEEGSDEEKDDEQSFEISSDENEDDDDFEAAETANLAEASLMLENSLTRRMFDPHGTGVEKRGDQLTALPANEIKADSVAFEEMRPSTSKDANDDSMQGEKKRKKSLLDSPTRDLVRRKKIEQIEEENKKMQVLMANFSEDQLNRYEVYRRSAFQKSTIKKIIQTVCNKTVSHNVVIAMSGIAKVFVGEIVEKALDVKDSWNQTGPLQPEHIRDAYRIYKNTNKLASSYKFKKPALF